MEISELSKQATAYKKAGDFKSAIQLMKRVEVLMDSDKENEYRAESYCRLPLCIYESGQLDEALEQFKKVLRRFPYNWGCLKRNSVGNLDTPLAYQRAYIYDKIRLVLQREKKFIEAAPYSVLSSSYVDRSQLEFFTLLDPIWRGKRKPKENWRDWMDYKEIKDFLKESPEARSEYVIESAEKLLKKANKLDVLESLKNYTIQLIQDTNKPDETILLELRLLLRGFTQSSN